jgi:hypothetical protein
MRMSMIRHPFQTIAMAASMLVLGGLVTVVSASMLDRVTVYGFEIRQSEGTSLRQHLVAETSRVDPDDYYSLVAEKPFCRLISEGEDPSAEITSARVRYFFRGWTLAPPEGEPAPELPLDVLRGWNEELKNLEGLPRVSNPSRGDFLFSSEPGEDKVWVDLGERGELFAEHLLWTEQFQRFVALGGFRQRTVNENGDRILTTGIVFTADRNFQNISYQVVGDETIEFEIE